jgi:hypothetical protein
MAGFEEKANDCSAIVVFDGLKKGFECLQKYVDDLKGDCEHVPNADMEECIHMGVIGDEIFEAFKHSIEILKVQPEVLVSKLKENMVMATDVFTKMQERILEMSMPIWLDMEEDPMAGVLDGSDLHVILDMCDPLYSFGRATDIMWDQDCLLFESIMCMTVDPSNTTHMSTKEGEEAMYFCARAYSAFYPHDDGIFSECLMNSAANAGGPEYCVEEELDPLVVSYLNGGAAALHDYEITSPAGTDQTHNLEDAMYTMTMDPVDVIDANVEKTTYTLLRRLHDKKQARKLQDEQDCVSLNGKKYCTSEPSTENTFAPVSVPASNGKITKAHKFFTRKHKARKLHRAHKHLMRNHRKLSRK